MAPPGVPSRHQATLLGLAIGDALGTTVEFEPRGSFPPVTDMVGGGPFGLKPGQWTDDTSMALCLAASLTELGRFDAKDQMDRYCKWWRTGYMSSTGRCFDIGHATSTALEKFEQTGDPFSGSTHPRSAGNGCIMRLAPVPMFFFSDREKAIKMSGESSRTTHGASECIEASKLFGGILHSALSGQPKEQVLFAHGVDGLTEPKIIAIAQGQYRDKSEDQIRGSGYVVECLEAALWCVLRTDNFKDAVLRAVNLGDDADTTAAVCGQLAGAIYGIESIPTAWIDTLKDKEKIMALASVLSE